MKRIFLSLIAVLAITLLPAQSLDYPTDTIRGEVYYIYPVQKGEGLYRISKNFGVSQEAIIKANPELEKQGLRLGQTIKIPYTPKIDTSKHIAHKIMPKETLYGLSKRYGVSIAAIQAANPEVSKRMPIGATLLIPRQTEETKRLQQEAPTVKDRSTPQVETSASPRLPQRESSRDTIHGVSQTPPTPIIDLSLLFGDKMDSTLSDTLALADTLAYDSLQTKPLRIAYLLPLMTNQAKRTASVDRFIEFYEGALIALYEAQRAGQKFEIYVYDTDKNDVRIQTILQQPEMQELDAIIGPAYPSQIAYVSKFAYAHQIPTLIPFANQVADIDINPYLWQFNPSIKSETDTLMAYITRTYPTANYVFIESNTTKPATSISTLKQHLIRENAHTQTISQSAVLNDSLSLVLQADAENIIVFDTEKANQLTTLMEKIRMVKDSYSLTLFSHYAWQEELFPIKSFYASVFNTRKGIDLPRTAYTLKFHHFFGNELLNHQPRYDLLGYDLTTYMLQQLQSDSTLTEYQGLQSDIHFKQVSEHGGYENTGIQIMTK